jgi:hypothetical protein
MLDEPFEHTYCLQIRRNVPTMRKVVILPTKFGNEEVTINLGMTIKDLGEFGWPVESLQPQQQGCHQALARSVGFSFIQIRIKLSTTSNFMRTSSNDHLV